ncbi:hypothetical protein [Kitasatospora sp. NRRL B-11411]|uniref:hypothetical protein n=1 Tax=Kitasatospora sp. NRRL B-11411 TaxID=1463822 RepID=UPI0004C31D01|nr:hypothetical protein [Kitasatospora sp. NRRL B-11411]
MTVALCILAAALGIATALNLSLTFAVIRRLREIESRPIGPGMDRLPAVGTAIGGFDAGTTAGGRLGRADLAAGEFLAGFVMTGCGPCADLVAELDRTAAVDTEKTLFFVTGDPEAEETAALAAKLGRFGRVVLVGHNSSVTAAFGGVMAYPTLLRIRDGVITHAGTTLDVVARPLAGTRAAS